MEAKTIKQALKRYLTGDSAEPETGLVEKWYSSFEEKEPVALTEEERVATKAEIWERIVPAIEEAKKGRVLPLFWKVAAVAAILAGLVFTILLTNHNSKERVSLSYKTFTTANGEKKTITIQDGTQLTLNAGSTIHVYDDFSKDRRVDLVNGQVFFEVKHDEARPFHIESEGLTVTVLGTSFDINAYQALHKLTVDVVTGKVRVQKEADTLGILTKTQQLVFDKDKQLATIGTTDESLLAWKEGRLVLNDASFDEMSFFMKTHYGIEVLSEEDAIRNTRYTTSLFTSMTPDQAMEVLAAIHNLKIKQKNDQYYLLK